MAANPKSRPILSNGQPFVAIDFETADYGSDSACAIGLVRVENSQIVRREVSYIRPPRSRFDFTYVHGITWQMVAKEAIFGDVWPRIRSILDGATFLAAHNARFDRGVLTSCCAMAGLPVPALPFVCTVQLAKAQWGLFPNDLPSVCRRLKIDLRHHDPISDAEACARIVLAAASSCESPTPKVKVRLRKK
jgi:DNA polymerase III subunit epsilon